jgi:hypothetical protein
MGIGTLDFGADGLVMCPFGRSSRELVVEDQPRAMVPKRGTCSSGVACSGLRRTRRNLEGVRRGRGSTPGRFREKPSRTREWHVQTREPRTPHWPCRHRRTLHIIRAWPRSAAGQHNARVQHRRGLGLDRSQREHCCLVICPACMGNCTYPCRPRQACSI